jgi:Holliday junction resolvase RusA-like endonuclease
LAAVVIELYVVGTPMPQGSHTAYIRGGKAIVVPAGSAATQAMFRTWRRQVKEAGEQWLVENPQPPIDEPVRCFITTYMPLPEGDPYRTRHATTPDWDKLARSICDSLTDSGILCNDSRIFHGSLLSLYARPDEHPGCRIRIWTAGEAEAEDRAALKLAAKRERSPQLSLI